ncbi:MAG: hypothetical protein ACQERN_02755 [Thermodesulfobacteriota bacterium]
MLLAIVVIFILPGTAVCFWQPDRVLYIDSGLYFPTGNLDEAGLDSGYQIGLGYQNFFSDCFGFEISGRYTYTAENLSRLYYDEKNNVFLNENLDRKYQMGGMALLALSRYHIGSFEIYGGAGVGYYYSEYDSDINGAVLVRSDGENVYGKDYAATLSADDTAAGYLIKTGGRYFFTEKFFAGLNVSHIWLEFDYAAKLEAADTARTYEWTNDLDGFTSSLEFGFRF